MNQHTHSSEAERFVRCYAYDDETVLVADIDAADEAVSVDTVDGTAIIVVEHDGRDEEFELELPGPATSVETHNGVLSITIQQ